MDPGPNWSDAFRAGADALIEAWRFYPPDRDGPEAGQTIAEFAVHTWDLERATGQSHGVDEAAADSPLGISPSRYLLWYCGMAYSGPVLCA